MTTTQTYTAFTAQAREVTEKSVEAFKLAAQANVDLATKWTQLVAAFSGVASGRVEKDGTTAVETVETVIQATEDAAERVVDVTAIATSVAEATVTDEVDEAVDAGVDEALEAERAEAKHARELAREPYRSLTKAELSGLLAERGLPKTGTVGTLIERLVAADSAS